MLGLIDNVLLDKRVPFLGLLGVLLFFLSFSAIWRGPALLVKPPAGDASRYCRRERFLAYFHVNKGDEHGDSTAQ